MWTTFSAAVCSFVEFAGQEDGIVAAALGTLTSLHSWCDEGVVVS